MKHVLSEKLTPLFLITTLFGCATTEPDPPPPTLLDWQLALNQQQNTIDVNGFLFAMKMAMSGLGEDSDDAALLAFRIYASLSPELKRQNAILAERIKGYTITRIKELSENPETVGAARKLAISAMQSEYADKDSNITCTFVHAGRSFKLTIDSAKVDWEKFKPTDISYAAVCNGVKGMLASYVPNPQDYVLRPEK